MPGRRFGWLTADGWLVVGCAALLVALSLGVHAIKYPDFSGFWAGTDQHRYLVAAQAWAAGDHSPALHHYLPFYPLLGAAFVRLTPWQPFMLPDALCLAASLLIFVQIGRRLAPAWPGCALAACFMAGVLAGRSLLAIWVVPWSTTGSAPFQFAAVLFTLRLLEKPCFRRAVPLGLAVACIAGFRPSDAAVLLATGGATTCVVLLRERSPPRVWAGILGGGGAGLLAGLAPVVAAHLMVFGWSPGPYIGDSAAMGFEWRLLPMRWVMLVVDPRPLLQAGPGMAEALPWIVPGVAGLLLSLVPRRTPAFTPAVFVASTVALHWALYLAYRDLQPYGLWRFYNIHYFKWTFPFLVLWAVQWVLALAASGRRRTALLAGAAVLLLFAWRPGLREPATLQAVIGHRRIELPDGIHRLDQAIGLKLTGRWESEYFGRFVWRSAGRDFENTRDFKILPVSDGALLIPLRRLPPGPATLELPDDVQVTPNSPVMLFRQELVPGPPCMLLKALARSCS